MNELLMKFYQEVIQYENDSIEYGKQLDEEAIHLLEAYKEKFNDEEMEIQSYVAQTPKSYMAEDLADVRIHSLLLLPATTHVFLKFRDKTL